MSVLEKCLSFCQSSEVTTLSGDTEAPVSRDQPPGGVPVCPQDKGGRSQELGSRAGAEGQLLSQACPTPAGLPPPSPRPVPWPALLPPIGSFVPAARKAVPRALGVGPHPLLPPTCTPRLPGDACAERAWGLPGAVGMAAAAKCR